jgi:hypothetical protein
MNYIYNATTKTYTPLAEFSPAGVVKGDPIRVLICTDLDSIFNEAKRRTALRGRFALDQQGASLLEKIAMTDDERDWFDQIIKNGGTEIFAKVSAWTKDLPAAYRHNVKFGIPLFAGAVTTVAGAVVNDTTKSYTVNDLTNKKLVITSPGPQMNQERVITSNTATGITLATAFTTDVTGMEYVIVAITADFIIFYLNLDLSWDLNLFQGVAATIQEAFILFVCKEWYKLNRNVPDFQVEELDYIAQLGKIRSQLLQYKIPARRVTDFFQ